STVCGGTMSDGPSPRAIPRLLILQTRHISTDRAALPCPVSVGGQQVGVHGDEPGTALEWPASLDVRELLESGWRPTPIRDFILKVHSRCNLACDYCYMYEMADQGWRRQPRRMSRQVIDWTAHRICEHARGNLISEVQVVLHGGEPLLAGVDHLRYALETITAAARPDVDVAFSVQTNGVLLDELFLDLFTEDEDRKSTRLNSSH